MTTANKPPSLVVLHLTGGNDYMNSVIPYTDPNYYDSRTKLAIAQEGTFSRWTPRSVSTRTWGR